jgi:hypothetical protein
MFGNASPKSLSWQTYLENGILSPMAKKKKDPAPKDMSSAERLRILREYARCETQTEFAHKYGFGVKQWNNLERGYALAPPVALQLCRKFPGISLDWLFRGLWDHLPGVVRAELEAAEKRLITSAEETERSRG